MVMKTYLKTLLKTFQKHIVRFISLACMVIVSIGFISGIGSTGDIIDSSLTDYYRKQNVSDFIVRSTKESGFDSQALRDIQKTFGEDCDYDFAFQIDLHTGEKRSVRLYFVDFADWSVNVPSLIDGEWQDGQNPHKIYAEQADNTIIGYSVGDQIDIALWLQQVVSPGLLQFLDLNVEVAAVVQSPLTFAEDGEPSDYAAFDELPQTTSGTQDMEVLENILYIPTSLIANPATGQALLPTNAVFVALHDRDTFEACSSSYRDLVNAMAARVADDETKVLTLYDNYSFQSLLAYSQKVAEIGYVIMIAFLLVTVLVVLSTMTRLIEEERSQIACLKTLGYSSARIVANYFLFAFLATSVGSLGAYFVGLGITRLIYYVFNYSFAMPPICMQVTMVFYSITVVVIVGGTLLTTVLAGAKTTRKAPAELLRPKPPKAGKKVLMEKIPFLWNKLSFKYKSTARNILRYKSRFFMTTIAVAFSCALVMAGLALLDLCLFHDFGSGAIRGIAVLIIVFAGLLNVLVIYTLTAINISERNREIATLMVLGYHNNEVVGYIYREIFVNTFIGILCGYPASIPILLIVFNTMGIGSLGGISWFMWLLTPLIVLVFTLLVALVLRRKITKVDMNESLKAIE